MHQAEPRLPLTGLEREVHGHAGGQDGPVGEVIGGRLENDAAIWMDGPQVVNAWEDFFSLQGRPPQNADWADIQFYPSVLYHDARVGVDIARDFSFYVGVDNFTDRNPPLGLTGVGAGSGIYNIRGRNYYAGVRARF